MKNKSVWIIVIVLILLSVALKTFVKDEVIAEKPLNINVGDEFDFFESKNKKYVLNYTIGDITGDDINDMVILIGEKDSVENGFAKEIDVVLYNSGTNEYIKLELKKLDGDNPKIDLADFSGDGLSDAIITVQNNGIYNARIITSQGGDLKEIFKDRDNKGLLFSLQLMDGFKLNVANKKLNVNNIIELQNEKDVYVKDKIFEESGKLIDKQVIPKTTGFVNMEVVELSDRYGIRTTQRIIVNDKMNIADEITVIWKYQDGKWQIKEAKGLRQGNLLY